MNSMKCWDSLSYRYDDWITIAPIPPLNYTEFNFDDTPVHFWYDYSAEQFWTKNRGDVWRHSALSVKYVLQACYMPGSTIDTLRQLVLICREVA